MIDKIELIKLGNLYGFGGGNYAGNVYDINGLSPTIRTPTGGGLEPMIIEPIGEEDEICGNQTSDK